ncbi:hypothetical protein JCM10213_007229 [Rhodosporidiobolus nylandii]
MQEGQMEQQDRPRPDRLGALPNELLEAVFAYVDCISLAETPLSKRLWPFQQQALFRAIGTEQAAEVVSLVAAVKAGRPWCNLVQSVYINLPLARDDDGEWALADVSAVEGDFADFLSALTGLRDLELFGVSTLASLLFCQPRMEARISLPRLTSFTCDLNLSRCDPFHPAHLSSLAAYPSLRRLSISTFHNHFKNVPRHPLHTVTPSFSLAVTELHLGGQASGQWAAPAVDAFPALVKLEVEDDSYLPHLLYLLRALPNPAHLTSLNLSTRLLDELEPEFDDTLSLFTSLQQLSLSGGLASHSQQFYHAVRRLPLLRLAFTRNAEVNYGHLASLVYDDPHPSLREVVLDHISGRRGRSIVRRDGTLRSPVHEDGQVAPLDGWELPDWGWDSAQQKPASSEGLRALLEVSKGGTRAVISGTALEALQVEDEWEYESRLLERFKRAVEEGWVPKTEEELLDAGSSEADNDEDEEKLE